LNILFIGGEQVIIIVYSLSHSEAFEIVVTKNNTNSCFKIINLEDGCVTEGTVIHEIMHALGFYHEHNDQIETTIL